MAKPRDERQSKECPLCGELMRLRTLERAERIPGISQVVTHHVREWVCPDCSYEEEVEDE